MNTTDAPLPKTIEAVMEFAHQEPTYQGGYDGYGEWVVTVEECASSIETAIRAGIAAGIAIGEERQGTELDRLRNENEALQHIVDTAEAWSNEPELADAFALLEALRGESWTSPSPDTLAASIGATPAFTTVYTDAGWSPVPLPDNGQPAVEDGATPEKTEP